MIKKILLAVVVLVLLVLIGGGGFVFSKVSAFDDAAKKKWDVPLADVKALDLKEAALAAANPAPAAEAPKPDAVPPPIDTSPEAAMKKLDEETKAAEAAARKAEQDKLIAVYTRGKHLADSIGACKGCHGADLATPEVIDMGPVGKIMAPNISVGGKLKEYSDAQLHRLLTSGVKNDGTSVIFMPTGDFRWWPDEDIMALAGYLRTMPAVDKVIEPSTVGTLGKVLDRTDKLPLMQAERMAAKPREIAKEAPAATVEYGKNLGGLCMGCHGETLSGGPIPGAPPELPIPANITSHKTGIAHYDFAKFKTLVREGKKPDGSALNPFMPVRDLKNMNEIEMEALWKYLQSVPAKEFGGR